jgi:hypothetical protein
MKLLSTVFALLLFCSCREDKLTITNAGDFGFRRSYSEIQFRDISDQELDSIRNSNPRSCDLPFNHTDSLLIFQFQKEGILDSSYHLIRSKFPDSVQKQFILTGKNGNQVQGAFIHPDGREPDRYQLVITGRSNKAVFDLEEHYGASTREISYCLLDLIPGGYPEIVVLNEYYIMNGDNSDIFIYQVTN